MNKNRKKSLVELPAIQKYKRIYRKRFFETALLILFFESVLICVFCKSLKSQDSSAYFFLGFIVLFGMLELNMVMRFIKSFSWKANKIGIGKVLMKSHHSKTSLVKNTANRGFFVIVETETGEQEGRCLFSEYKRINIGDNVLLFTMGTSQKFAILVE